MIPIRSEEIKRLAAELFPMIQQIRRTIHANPELSFQEVETSHLLKNALSAAGITEQSTWVNTGILAKISGIEPGKTVSLRGDMDALPIQEDNQVSYASVAKGIMHACGHDVHSACVLGAGIILKKLSAQWKGQVQLVFQPGEEKLPGGAHLMLEEGMFKKNPPGKLIAQHVFPNLPAGEVGFKSGSYMASTDEIYIRIQGQGGHGALPHTLKDPVLSAAHVIVALQQIVSRHASPGTPTVLSFGKVLAEGATNVIPDQVYIEGTFRTMDETWREKAHSLLQQIAESTAKAFGTQAVVDIRKGYPVLVNDESLTEQCRSAAEEYLGKKQVHELEKRMTAEDFAWFAQEYPACFYRLGTASRDVGFTSGVHTSTFDIDEKAIETGMGLMAWLALKELESI